MMGERRVLTLMFMIPKSYSCMARLFSINASFDIVNGPAITAYELLQNGPMDVIRGTYFATTSHYLGTEALLPSPIKRV